MERMEEEREGEEEEEAGGEWGGGVGGGGRSRSNKRTARMEILLHSLVFFLSLTPGQRPTTVE